MRPFAFLCSILLIAIGGAAYRGWEARGWEGPVPTSAMPAAIGALMLLGFLLSLGLRRTGLQIAFLSALAGAGLGVGRLLPAYLEKAFDPGGSYTQLLLAMAAVGTAYALVAAIAFLFRPRPTRRARRVEEKPEDDVNEGDALRGDAHESEEDEIVPASSRPSTPAPAS